MSKYNKWKYDNFFNAYTYDIDAHNYVSVWMDACYSARPILYEGGELCEYALQFSDRPLLITKPIEYVLNDIEQFLVRIIKLKSFA